MEANKSPSITDSGTKIRLGSNLNILLIMLISLPLFYFSGFEGGYLRDEVSMGSELKSPSNSLVEWNLSNEAPFKYRILFKTVVFQVATKLLSGSNRDFYYAYVAVSYSFFLGTLLMLYSFIRINGFSPSLSWVGLALFMVSPVILMAYKIPVHLREDYMAYFILLAGLFAIQKNNMTLLLVTFMLGVLCRETLLILPFTYLFFTQEHSSLKRLVFALIPIILLLITRYLVGIEHYDYFTGLKWNLENPLQVVGFSLIAFHFMWIPVIVYLIAKDSMNLSRSYIERSLIPVVALIIITTFFGGIFNEIRLLFLAFPWFIIVVLKVIDKNKELGLSQWLTKFKIILFLGCQPFIIFIIFNLFKQLGTMEKSTYEVPYEQWMVVSILYFELLLFGLIHYFPIINIKRLTKSVR